MPNCSALFEDAAIVRSIREIYPTLTYPIHTTLITGVCPDAHGIPHNQLPSISPEDPDFSIMGSDWYWEKSNIRVPTLPDLLFEQGRNVATVLWPVTAGEKRGVNIPEIWPPKGYKGGVRELFSRVCSKNAFETYFDRYIGKYDWANNEDMVAYSVEIALDIVRRMKPDLLLCHITHLDHTRHVYGVQGREIDNCLRQLDIIAGRFAEAAHDAGVFEDTNFVILGDHGQIEVESMFSINTIFRDAGLIKTDSDGKVLSYDAYSFSAGFSAQIMLKEPEDRHVSKKVEELLRLLPVHYPEYIESVYTARGIHAMEGLSGDFSFVVEARTGVLLPSDITDHVEVSRERAPYAGMHGHHPNKGEKPPFIAFGPDIQGGIDIDNGSMLDIAPTLAMLLGVNLAQAQGRPFPISVNEPVYIGEKINHAI